MVVRFKKDKEEKTMKIIAIIPARYQSSRFPGKPIADLNGKPLIWWSYNQVIKCGFDNVIIATDDERIAKVCKEYNMNFEMTPKACNTSTERIYFVAQHNFADCYIVINGDEPLIQPKEIMKVVPKKIDNFYVCNLMTKIKNPIEAIDQSNIKVIVDKNGYAIYFSRNVIPFPKSTLIYDLYKHVGVLSYSFESLQFFSNTKRGPLETIEDINELRFIENRKPIKMIKTDCKTLSVDTPKDLEKIRKMMEGK